MLLDKKDDIEFNERLNKAFRYDNNKEKSVDGDKVFEEYLLGGVEILYEKIIQGATVIEDYIDNIYEFLSEYNERYNVEINDESIYELCKNSETNFN